MKKKIALFLALISLLSLFSISCSGTKYEAVMEYNGIELKENMYYYWLATFKRNILETYSDAEDSEEFWNSKFNDSYTVEEYFTERINNEVMNYLVSQSLYKDNTLRLDSATKKAIEADIKEKIEYFGSRGKLNSELKQLKLDTGSLKDVYTWKEKHDLVYNYYYGKNGVDEISDEKLAEYYRKNYSRIKYIVFYTSKILKDDKGNEVYDDSGNLKTEPLTKEELDAKLLKIEECKSAIDSGSSFDEMIKKYSEYDTSKYPNGFFVSSNEIQTWGTSIVLAAADAKVGDVVKVEEQEAIYLIEKCELTDLVNLSSTDKEQLSQMSVYATREHFETRYSTLRKEITVFSDILSKYKLSEIKPNPYFSI